MITHNMEVSGAICSEPWSVVDGLMTPSGQAPGGGPKEKVEFK